MSTAIRVTRRASWMPFVVLLALQQQDVPIRQVGPIDATSSDTVEDGTRVREMRNGRVLVYGGGRRTRVRVFDRTLSNATTIADSATLSPGMLVRFLAVVESRDDRIYVVDYPTSSLLILDANGKSAGVMALPRADDAQPLMASRQRPAFDQQKRIVYQGRFKTIRTTAELGQSMAVGTVFDSFPLVRADFDARRVDTLAVLREQSGRSTLENLGRAGGIIHEVLWPFPLVDDWVLLPDGAVAIVRGHDYHIDWISPDGKVTSTAKMQFDWKRITDEDKQRLIDSLRTVAARMNRSLDSARRESRFPPGTARMTIVNEAPPASDLPDYYPPITVGNLSVDQDGNIWSLPTTSVARGGLVYDVINRRGEVFERVQLPAGARIAGFGQGGAIYMTQVETNGIKLVRARIRR